MDLNCFLEGCAGPLTVMDHQMECLYRLFLFMYIINGAKSLTYLVLVMRTFKCSDLFVELYAHICFSFGVTSTDTTSHWN